MPSDANRPPETADWRRDIATLEDDGRRAFVAGDLERLEQLWSDRLLVNSPINRIHDKRVVLQLLRVGTIAHHSFAGEIEAMERHGDLVVVMGSEAVTDSPGGPLVRRRFTNLWRAEGTTWRLVARHANVMADPAPAA